MTLIDFPRIAFEHQGMRPLTPPKFRKKFIAEFWKKWGFSDFCPYHDISADLRSTVSVLQGRVALKARCQILERVCG